MKQKPLEQVHLCVGFESVAAGHKDRYAVYALNSVLGGSVSSRLFQEIREKRGLSYSVYSFLSGYSDSGTITVYAGTRSREVGQVLDLIHREIRKLVRNGIGRAELTRTKDQMKGSLMLSLESSHSRMNKLAKDELITGAHTTLDSLIAGIESVTEQQVFQAAQNLFTSDRIALTGFGSSFFPSNGGVARNIFVTTVRSYKIQVVETMQRIVIKAFWKMNFSTSLSCKHFLDRTSQFQYRSGTTWMLSHPGFCAWTAEEHDTL